MICAREGCGRPGPYVPIVEVREKSGLLITEATIGLAVCAEHAIEKELLVSEQGWEKLVGTLRALGRRPSRKATTVRAELAEVCAAVINGTVKVRGGEPE